MWQSRNVRPSASRMRDPPASVTRIGNGTAWNGQNTCAPASTARSLSMSCVDFAWRWPSSANRSVTQRCCIRSCMTSCTDGSWLAGMALPHRFRGDSLRQRPLSSRLEPHWRTAEPPFRQVFERSSTGGHKSTVQTPRPVRAAVAHRPGTGRGKAMSSWGNGGNTEYKPDIFTLTDAITPWAVRAAATLKLADLIAAGATRLEDLASKAGAGVDALRRLMRYLTVRGVFTESEPGVFGLTEVGAVLKADHPAGRRPWWDVDGVAGRIEGAFIRLTDSIRTGDAAYPLVYGQSFYDDLAGNPERATSFNALMATHAAYFDKGDAGDDCSGVKHVFDVGGGTGALLTEILKAHPHLRGTLVDLSTVVKQAEGRFADAGVSDRASVFGGSIFEPLPTGGDGYGLADLRD